MSANAAVFTPPAQGTEDHEPRIVLSQVPWAAYVVLRDAIASSGVRMTYLGGQLEIVSPSRKHEVSKKQIARLLELFALERSIPLYGYGSTTFREEKQERGLEPDECYCRGRDAEVPDVALEVVVTASGIDKLDVYRGLGVQEVWVFEEGAFRVEALRDHGGSRRYETLPQSEILPEIDLALLARFAAMPDQHDALQRFRDHLRQP